MPLAGRKWPIIVNGGHREHLAFEKLRYVSIECGGGAP
jgi:hypothetical protein